MWKIKKTYNFILLMLLNMLYTFALNLLLYDFNYSNL